MGAPRVRRVQSEFLLPLSELMVSLSNGSPLSSHGLRSLSFPSPLLSHRVWQTLSQSWLCSLIFSLPGWMLWKEQNSSPHQPCPGHYLHNTLPPQSHAVNIQQNYMYSVIDISSVGPMSNDTHTEAAVPRGDVSTAAVYLQTAIFKD